MNELDNLREQIDKVDSQLIDLFLKRMDISEKVARYKALNGLPIFNPEREREIIEMRKKQSSDDLAAYVEQFFTQLMDLSKDLQKKIIEND